MSTSDIMRGVITDVLVFETNFFTFLSLEETDGLGRMIDAE